MKYEVRKGFRGIRSKEADKLAREFLGLEKKLDRPPTAEDIVEAARKGRSTFWQVFERAGLWDDRRAAEVARLTFARYILRAITVHLEVTEGAVEQPAFIAVRYTDDGPTPDGGYVATETVLQDQAMARAYLRRLQREAVRLAEDAKAWEWLIKTVVPAEEFVAAAGKLAEAPI